MSFEIQIENRHECFASPREVIENYVDYGHEVYWHGKYASDPRKRVSKIARVSYKILSEFEREVSVPVVFFSFLRWTSVQRVTLVPWSGIESRGSLLPFVPTHTTWRVARDSESAPTRCEVLYRFRFPAPLFPFKPLLDAFLRRALLHLRTRIWEEDRVMLERRDRLLKKGFRDWGHWPETGSQ